MAFVSSFQKVFLLVVATFFFMVHADQVTIGGFHSNKGMTGCTTDPSRQCVDNSNGDTCYKVRGLDFSLTGTAPTCDDGCMPKDYLNIAMYSKPADLPCALWRYYGCDNLFVTYVWMKSGSNACTNGGRKSYNVMGQLAAASAAENEQEFIKTCRQARTVAHYRLPPLTRMINERDFCFSVKNNLTIHTPTKTLSNYQQYYDQKYNTGKDQ